MDTRRKAPGPGAVPPAGDPADARIHPGRHHGGRRCDVTSRRCRALSRVRPGSREQSVRDVRGPCCHRGPAAMAPRAAAKRTRRRHPLAAGFRRELKSSSLPARNGAPGPEEQACPGSCPPGPTALPGRWATRVTTLSRAAGTRWPGAARAPPADGFIRRRPCRRVIPGSCPRPVPAAAAAVCFQRRLNSRAADTSCVRRRVSTAR